MFSVSLAYGLGVGQVVLLGAIILCYPPAKVQTYAYVPCVVNGSLSRPCGRVKSSWVDLAGPCGVLSLAAASYVIRTFRRSEEGLLQEEALFNQEGVGKMGHLDAHFWFLVAWAHCVVVFMACSPVDTFTAIGAGVLMSYALARMCRPADPEQGMSAGAAAGALVYLAGVAVAWNSVPPHYANRYSLGAVTLILDYILGIGHVWDRSTTTMETVANCRVSYASWCALFLAGAYAAWGDDLVMPSASGDSPDN